jgi:hypothetical protein
MTSGSVTFIIPAGGGGSCEARLFANNGFTRLAATTISAIDFNWITLSLIPSTPTGTFSVTAVLGSPIPTTQRDWVGLFCPGTENDFGYVDWKYMNNSRVAPATAWSSLATLTFNVPAMVGMKCDVRLFRNNGFDRVITSWRATLR